LASTIDATKPDGTIPTTQSVRDNFAAAKSEIEAVQVSSGIEFTQSGTGAVARTVESKQRDIINLRDQGVAVDGTAASTEIQALINNVNALGGGVIKANDYDLFGIDAKITIKNGVTLDFGNAKVIPLSDIDMFDVNEGGKLIAKQIVLTGISYSSTVATLQPTQNIRGGQWQQPWADIGVEHTIGAGNGTTCKLNAAEYYIQQTRAIVDSYGGNKSLHLIQGDEATEYCNGNIIKLTAHNPVISIHEDTSAGGGGDVAGNMYFVMLENNGNNAEIILNTRSIVHGLAFDRVKLTMNGNENYVAIRPGLLQTDVDNNGRLNKVYGGDCEITDLTSISNYHDKRSNYYDLKGTVEFNDWFINKVRDEWTQGGVGTPAITFGTINSGGAAASFTRSKSNLTTSASANDSVILNWDNPYIRTGHNPIIHATCQLETADVTAKIGLWGDANNHILMVSDVANTKWIATVTSGGTSTTYDFTSNFNRLQIMSIIVDNSNVLFQFGDESFSGNNTALGRQRMDLSTTITTNIPVTTLMSPYIYVETLTTAAKALNMYDFQLVHSYLCDVL